MIQLLLESTIVWGPCIQHVLLSGGVSHTDNSRWILLSLLLCDKTSSKKKCNGDEKWVYLFYNHK